MSVSELKVLIVSSEVSPYAKSGGLGDVIGSLPGQLKKHGVDVRVCLPKYKSIKQDYLKDAEYVNSFVVTLGWRNQSASIYKLDNPVPTYFIENDYYFGRDGYYGYGDDFERFAFFSKACVELLGAVDFQADVIHFNDWQTGVAGIYLKDYYGGFLFYKNIKTLLTIHNLQYQGVFGKEILGNIDLNNGYFTTDKTEHYGMVNFLKAGINYADAVSTVSESYSREIQTYEYGYGMNGVLSAKSHRLFGILNGIDVDEYNPKTDKHLFKNFDAQSINARKENKLALQNMLGLAQRDVPMIGIISRLVDQKGFDLIAVAMEELMAKDIQIVVLGTGDGRYEYMFKSMAERAPDKVSANITFSEDLARKIYSSSDMFLMPSLFEPCGLGQLFAMRYGSIPIVRETGGLADTVTHFNPEEGTGNGFVFKDYLASGMMWAVNNALNIYYNGGEQWNKLVENAMNCDFSWKRSAEQYVELYIRLKNGQ